MTKEQQLGRLAMRVEGDNWNAYYALPDSMIGAIFLGSIKMKFVQNINRKQIFQNLMQEAVGDIIEEQTGQRPFWRDKPIRAPESERTKDA